MKNLQKLFTGFLILLFFTTTFLVASCSSEPEPQLTEPVISLKLSASSPQTQVIISWTPSDNAQSYTVERTMVRDSVTDTRYFEWRENDELCYKEGNLFCIKDNTCESGTEYSYVVTASARWYSPEVWNTTSKESEKKSITTAADPNTTLAFPENIKVEPTKNSRNSLTVTWDAVNNATAYEVYYAKSVWIHFNEKFVKLGETTQTSFTKNYLPNESSYTFMIKAINGDKYSLFSAKASGTVEAAKNLTKSKAVVLENGIREYFYSYSDSLWFKCTPQKGLVSFYSDYYLYDTSLSIFLEDGTVVASGLPLFTFEDEGSTNKNILRINDEDYDNALVRNIKNDINDFSAGTTYVLRIVKNSINGFAICVE